MVASSVDMRTPPIIPDADWRGKLPASSVRKEVDEREVPELQAAVPDGAKFCAECGTALPRTCPSCGHGSRSGAKFCPECGASLSAKIDGPKPVARPPATSRSSPERRQLTVMFCDMVGSSTLSTRLDPEEQREVVGAFQSCCANGIKRFGGMVAQYLGDGVLAYFGYPTAHEDDAERAVRAGLAILDVVGTLKPAPGVTLQARIGVASGVVVVGDLVREGVTQENAAIGETTNKAARLQSLAEPNTIVVSPRDTSADWRLVRVSRSWPPLAQGLCGAGARASGASSKQSGKPVRARANI